MHQIQELPSKRPPRIIDIALQAGVSTATVDRVLNKRPGVSRKTVVKVENAIAVLDAANRRPQIIPSKNRNITADVILASSAGFANEILHRELGRVAKESGVTLRFELPRRLVPHAECEALELVRERKTSGVIVQALDHPLVRDTISRLIDEGVPVISILTSLPGIPMLGYAGLDNRGAGRSAGLLMGRLVRKRGQIAVFIGGTLYRSHEEREIGFRSLLADEFPELSMLETYRGNDDPHKNYEMAAELLSRYPDLTGIYNLGGGNRGIEKALIESGRQDEITYIAFNLTPLTRQALLTNVMDAVIHQNMHAIATMAIGALIDHLSGQPVSFAHVPTEIIMRENVR